VLKIPHPSCFKVSVEKSAVTLMGLSLHVIQFFSLIAFNILSLFSELIVLTVTCYGEVLVMPVWCPGDIILKCISLTRCENPQCLKS
jgi:hypothetical protein